MLSTYTRILTRPGAWQFSVAGLIARFPMSMVGISTILAVQERYGSYSAAGTVSAANIVAAAVGSPLLARAVDHFGQRRVMLPAVLASAASLAGLIAATTAQAPLWALVILSALAGGLAGSMGSLVRSRWTVVLSSPDDIHTAFSLEAALDEVAFMIGPVLATALCTAGSLPVTSGWAAALAMQVGGGLWFLAQRATEPPVHPRPGRRSHRTAAHAQPTAAHARSAAPQPASRDPHVLSYGAVRCVVAIFLCSGMMFGANDVSAVALATELGVKGQAGTALAAWAAGSFLAALVYGARPWGWPLWKQLSVGMVWLAAGASTFLLAPNLMVLAVLYITVGLGTAPTITTGNNIVQAVVAPSQLTEGLAWIGTALNIGVSLGSLLAGHAIDAAGSRGGYSLTAVAAWAGVVVLLVGVRTLRAARPRRLEETDPA